MTCDWKIRAGIMHSGGMIEMRWTGEICGQPASVRYRQSESEAWGYRCAGMHADALDRDVVDVEVLAR